MNRNIATAFAARLLAHAASEKYPTRSVEYMLACMTLVFSYSLILPGEMIAQPLSKYIVAVAPEGLWGIIGAVVSVIRIAALVMNGGYRQSPLLRFIGAAMGLNWWLILFVLYTISVDLGAHDFPMRRVFLVLIFFEAYSCFRCGQDQATMKAKEASTAAERQRQSLLAVPADPGNG